MAKKYDFCGWATRHGVKCSDGRTIGKGAFADDNGKTVPLVWNHDHKDPDNVLGHALLEERDEGVYAYCSFNDNPKAIQAKELVQHGDINSLSIYANRLKQSNDRTVLHGCIGEVSLVLKGANPGACIESLSVVHSEDGDFDEAIIYNNSEELSLYHADKNTDEEDKNVEENKTEDNKSKDEDEKTIQDVIDTMTDEQRTVLNYLVGLACEEQDDESNDEDVNEGDNKMKHNAFENENIEEDDLTLAHDDFVAIIEDAKRCGSLKDAVNNYALAHSITGIENLFPDSKLMPGHPVTLNNDVEWVSKVIKGVHHTPFAKVKSMYFDITADEARARGYIKGDQKIDEVIVALQRETTPQTVYKHQSLDRDDIIDITDFDVVAYLKSEMQGKLDEELARAYLIGDGRTVSDRYKIKTGNIRPILGDDPLYSVPLTLDTIKDETEEATAKRLIKFVKKTRKQYKGKGSPTFFTTEDMLTAMLCIEDKNERVIYETPEQLAKALRVADVVAIPPMELAKRTTTDAVYECVGIMVNLDDYNVGSNKLGDKNFFSDFDIDYNKEKYLIECRQSGALVAPKSALTYELKTKKLAEAA